MAIDPAIQSALDQVMEVLAPEDGSAGLLDRIETYATNTNPTDADLTALIFDIIKLIVGALKTAVGSAGTA